MYGIYTNDNTNPAFGGSRGSGTFKPGSARHMDIYTSGTGRDGGISCNAVSMTGYFNRVTNFSFSVNDADKYDEVYIMAQFRFLGV